jgi:vitamin B12 transporter
VTHLCRVRSLLLGLSLAPGVALGQAAAPVYEVVVQGSPLDRRSTRDETAHSTVFRRKELTQPGASLASIVTRSPGAQVQRSGAASETATLSLRGTTSAQLPVYLGPVALNDELTGTTDLSLVPLFFIERIEVYRGHAPSFVDRLGLSGALVIEPRLPRGSEWYSGANFGSYGASSLYTGAAVGGEQASTLVAVQRTTAANDYPYWHNGGTVAEPSDDRRVLRQNADAVTLELWTTGHYRPTPTSRLRWLVHGLEREQGVTGLSIIPARHARAKTQRELGALTATLPCRASHPERDCSIELQSQWQHTNFALDDPYLELGYGTTRVDSASTRAGQRLRINQRVLDQWSLGWLLGTDIGALDWLNRGDTGLRAQRRSGLMGLNSSVQVNPKLTIVTLGRLSVDNTLTDQDAGKWQALPSGRVGFSYAMVPGLLALANVGSYGRTPTLAELYGISASLRGNHELRAERGTSEDLGLHWRWSLGRVHGNAEAIAYHQYTTDLVAWQRTSFSQIRPYNVGRARLLGAELSAGVGWTQSLRIEAVAALLDPRDVTPNGLYENKVIPYRSRFAGHLRFDAQLPRTVSIPGIRDAGVGATAQHRSSRYSDPASNAVLASSTTLDLDSRLALAPVPLTLRGSIVNVLDRQNYDLLGMPLPGRCYFVGAEINLEFER